MSEVLKSETPQNGVSEEKISKKYEVKVICLICKLAFDMTECEIVEHPDLPDQILWMCKSCVIKHEEKYGTMEVLE